MRQTLVSKTETRAYDSFQRMTSMITFDGTAIAYNYSQTANDGKIVSQVTGGETVNYTYDVLGRLSQATTAGAGGWGMSWMYDGWGNRLQQAAVKGSVPTMVSITDPATNRIQAHTYDANGNTVSTPQQGAMTYDVVNRLKTVAADTYGYDPSNKRIWKNDEYTFWGAAGERIGRYSAVKLVNDAGTHVFVFQKVQVDEYFGGRRLTGQDRRGSVGSYYLYGEAKSGTVSKTDSFATYYRDSTGLDYAMNRSYFPGIGRFATADPFQPSAKLAEPDSWNRFSYTQTDPMNRNDPSALASCCVTGWVTQPSGTFAGVRCVSSKSLHSAEARYIILEMTDALDWQLARDAEATWGRALDLLSPNNASLIASHFKCLEQTASLECLGFFRSHGINIVSLAGSVRVYSANDSAIRNITMNYWSDSYRVGPLTLWDWFHLFPNRAVGIASTNLNAIAVSEKRLIICRMD